jgi:hypothetical protein
MNFKNGVSKFKTTQFLLLKEKPPVLLAKMAVTSLVDFGSK